MTGIKNRITKEAEGRDGSHVEHSYRGAKLKSRPEGAGKDRDIANVRKSWTTWRTEVDGPTVAR